MGRAMLLARTALMCFLCGLSKVLREEAQLEIRYVVMVYGEAPENVPDVPDDVWLFYAPRTKNGGSTLADRLGGFYPLIIDDIHSSHRGRVPDSSTAPSTTATQRRE